MQKWMCVFVGIITLASAAKFIPIDRKSFEEFVETRNPVLVEFCVPWYEPCKTLSPELDVASTTLSKRDISVVSIDCTKPNLKPICEEYDITSYPTIRVFKGLQENERYRGRQDGKAIITYITKQTLPLISTVDTTNFPDILSLDLPTLITFIPSSSSSSDLITKLNSVAGKLKDDYIFGITSDSTLFGSETSSISNAKNPFIVFYNPEDEVTQIFHAEQNSEFTEDSILQFITKSTENSPIIGKFNPSNFAKYTENTKTPLTLLFAKTSKERTSLSHTIHPIAKKYSLARKMNFVTVDASKYGFFSGSLGLDPEKFPSLVIHDLGEDVVVRFEGEVITGEGVGEFVEGFLGRGVGMVGIEKKEEEEDEEGGEVKDSEERGIIGIKKKKTPNPDRIHDEI